ncbi:MAG TPA: DNA internalization-related competence protein ComEC/Rec2 [Gammaproteobacteria bacterium]
MAGTGGLPGIAAAVLFGNLCVHELAELPPPGAAAALLLLLPILLRFVATRWLVAAVIAFVWTAGVAQFDLDRRWPQGIGRRDVAVSGWIDNFPTVSPDRTVFSLRVTQAAALEVPERVRLSWYDAPPELAPGVHIDIVARLRGPRGLANPGAFDYERWLYLERIGATGYVRSGRVVAGAPRTLAQRWLEFRARLADRLMASAGSESGGALIVALTLGERYAFTDEHWTDLRRTGTSHLVSISGLHVALIAALCYGLVRGVCLRLPVVARYAAGAGASTGAGAAFLYAALAGFAVPTQRALVMVLVALAIVASRRLTGSFNGIAAALLIVLAVDPLATLAVSFWLSFVAVGLLLLLASRQSLRDPVSAGGKVLGHLRVAARLQWGITLGLAPYVALFFGVLSLSAPFVNCVAIPFFSFVMIPLSLIGGVIVALDVGDFNIVRLTAILADWAWHALHRASAWPWSTISLVPSDVARTVLAAGAAVLAIPSHPLPGRRLLWLALLPVLAAQAPRPPPGAAQVLIFDVGHGLAALIVTHEHNLLYDAGPVARSGFDAGEEIVVPALARRGVTRLDLLLVSHADADHAGGALSVLEAHPESRVLKGPDVGVLDGEVCTMGQRWTWDEVAFEILHPPAELGDRGNESSCVLKVVARGGSVLIAGDIEARGEQLLAGNDAVEADVVIVPHHGSATSSSPAFVAAVRPRAAVVSAAHDNRWGFPRAEVRQRWERAGAAVLVTGEVGAVVIDIGAEGTQVTAERLVRKRYWHAESGPLPGESGTTAL